MGSLPSLTMADKSAPLNPTVTRATLQQNSRKVNA